MADEIAGKAAIVQRPLSLALLWKDYVSALVFAYEMGVHSTITLVIILYIYINFNRIIILHGNVTIR